MAVWVIRAGRFGEFEEFALDEGIVSIDFNLRQSISEFADRDALRNHLQSTQAQYAENVHRAGSHASQLWRFVHDVEQGEIVVLPRKQPKVVAVGRIIRGDYTYEPDAQMHPPHTRTVEWTVQDIPRANFDQDLLYSLGGATTVFQVQAENADTRIQRVVSAYMSDSPLDEAIPIPDVTIDEGTTDSFDLDEYILDRIVARMRQKFAGVRLEYMVASILKAEGYTVLQTREGPDGGVDVVAGKGDMGFGEPRLCVQVKSTQNSVGLPDYNQLIGTVNTFGATHGLLVSLGGFTKQVRDANEQSFFAIRLWDAHELAQRLLDAYANLPPDIRADIPLQDRKVLVESDD